ncbi:MAG: hypothetical protein H6811_01160 [Phycisphaeraceae bacterium]|nr:hypothetical protein [Phycisphaeraceae bacterium]
MLQATQSQPAPANGPTPGQVRAARDWASLFLVVALLIVVSAVVLVLIRGRLSLGAQRRRAERTARLDAWAEAGRRAEPAALDDVLPDRDEDDS